MERTKKSLAVMLLLLILCQSSFALAWGRKPPRGHFRPHGTHFDVLPFAAATLLIAGAHYYYWEGEYYRRSSSGYVVVAPPVGAVVTAIPSGYQTIIIDGTPYYIANGVTYIYTSGGYQVVPTPRTVIIQNNAAQVITSEPAKTQNTVVTAGAENNSFTVNIPNSKGGYTAVTLTRSGSGFVGPQGEFYTEFPKIEQLKVMYGR